MFKSAKRKDSSVIIKNVCHQSLFAMAKMIAGIAVMKRIAVQVGLFVLVFLVFFSDFGCFCTQFHVQATYLS